MHRHFGAPDHVVSSVYGSSTPSYLLGGFAPEVAEAARAGDPAARGIWEEAGTLLASAASAASAGLEPVFSWSGRLFDAGELLLDPFRHALLALHPDAELVHPLGSSTDGALLIAARERIAGSAAPASFIASYDMNTAPAGGARHSAAMASGAKGTRSASTSARNSSSESPSSR
jgi:N-acetylglucosamine kinase-like BadF-type ATPase